MSTNLEVAVIVPTYNEKENILVLVDRINEALSGRFSYEVVVVDDDSPDGTAAVATSLSHQYPVNVILRKNILGLASAVAHGFIQSTAPILVVLDADLQHPPELLPELIHRIQNGADIAIASRYIPGSGVVGLGMTRNIISRIATLLAKLALPAARDISDPLSGFFALNRKVIMGTQMNPIGYKILLEVLAVGHYLNLKEIPYSFDIRGKGKSKYNTRVFAEYLQHLLSIALRKGEIIRIPKFIIVGGSGVVVNEGLLYVLTNFAGLYYLISSVIAIQFAILNNFLWNHLWTFRDRRIVKESMIYKLSKFELTSIVALLVNVLALYLGVTYLNLNYLIANLIGIAVAFVVNFVVNNIWTWRK